MSIFEVTSAAGRVTAGPAAARPLRLPWVLSLTSAAYFMVVLDSLVVATALPRISRDLGVGLATSQWTINSYGIAFAAGIITAAALGDRLGRRRVFAAGLALFTLASAACALAPTAPALIAARAVQGLGGAAVLPLSLTILTTAFPAERRGKIIGIYGGLAGLAVAAGPLVGGAVTEGLDWHWIFWINVPVGLAVCALSLRLLPESHGTSARLDLPGMALISAGVTGLVWGLVRASGAGWTSAETLGSLALGVICTAAFFFWESRAAEPMLPLGLLRVRAFAAGTAAGFGMSGAIFAAGLLVAEYFQLGRGYSPLGTGWRLLPWLVTPALVAPIAGNLSDRIGRRPVIVSGLLLQAAGLLWVALRAAAGASLPELMAALVVAGTGISMALPTVPAAVLGAVTPERMGQASGILNMTQRFGAVFAVAIGTSVFGSFGNLGSAAAVTSGFRPALAVAAAFSLLGALAALGVTAQPGPRPELAERP